MAKQKIESTDPLLSKVTNSEEYALVSSAGAAIASFLGGLPAFFTRAKELETRAFETLTTAQTMKAPTSSPEDEEIQRLIRRAAADKREVIEHWTITATVSKFHKSLTGRRGKAEDALDSASAQLNGLHNRYVEEARRKAAIEQERIRQEAEAKARADQEAALAKAEADAVAREEASADLSERELTFVDLVFATGDGQRSAQRAGYKNPLAASARLLSLAKIQKAIQGKREAAAIRQQAAADAKTAAAMPVEVPIIAPDVTKADGAHERTTHAAELLDEAALVRAILTGNLGIPTDLLRIDTTLLNDYARQLHERINRWPGVVYRKTTRVI